MPLLYNPASGGGRGRLRLRRAEALLAMKGIRTERHATGGPGDAVDLGRAMARDGHAWILVLGGDGTLSEVADGVLQSGRQPALGFLPGGTGNDFLRDFGVTDLDHAVERIALGTPRPVDAAHASWPGGDRHFLNLFGSGFVALAADTCNRRLKWMGSRGYTAAVLWELVRLRNTPTRLELDGRVVEGRFPLVAVCNSIHTGGAMRIAPHARCDDGVLDVMIVEDIGRVELGRVFPKIFDGSHVGHPKVRFERARTVRIEPESPSPLLVDGEVVGTTPADVQVRPGALRVLL